MLLLNESNQSALTDFGELQPEQARSLGWMLESNFTKEEFDDSFGEMTFEIEEEVFGEKKTNELVVGGKSKTLTQSNVEVSK